MRAIRVDSDGNLRCWKCGGRAFEQKRTTRSKVLVGIGALATAKKLKCLTCGTYNETGDSRPFKRPASRWLAKRHGTLQVTSADSSRPAATPQVVTVQPSAPTPHPQRSTTKSVPTIPGRAKISAKWCRDPFQRHELRYWNGEAWTDHVADQGSASIDLFGDAPIQPLDALARLDALRDDGALTDDEFVELKTQVMGGGFAHPTAQAPLDGATVEPTPPAPTPSAKAETDALLPDVRQPDDLDVPRRAKVEAGTRTATMSYAGSTDRLVSWATRAGETSAALGALAWTMSIVALVYMWFLVLPVWYVLTPLRHNIRRR